MPTNRNSGAVCEIEDRSATAADPSRRGAKRRWLPPLILAAAAVATFVLQGHKVGFEAGHHGWVSSHGLAIISHATWESGLLGYTAKLKDESGKQSYYYFDRYPVVFSATMRWLIQLAGDRAADQIFLARQIMNGIFLATLVVAYQLARLLLGEPRRALAAALLSFSGYYFIHYKDMVHFDQPALFGFLLLLYAVARCRLVGDTRWVYAAGLLAVSLGRGYASFAVLGAWVVLELTEQLGAKAAKHPEVFVASRLWTAMLHSRAARVSLLCFAASTSALAYNVWAESRIRHVSWLQTSIVDSARRRLGLENANGKIDDGFTWGEFAERQAKWLARSVTPYFLSRGDAIPKALRRTLQFCIAGALLYFLVPMMRDADPAKRKVYWLLVLSGFIWVLPMRKLTFFHDYTTIYYAGLSLTMFVALVRRVPSRGVPAMLLASMVVFGASLDAACGREEAIARHVNPITRDFERIRPLLRNAGAEAVFIPGGPFSLFPETPYSVAYYMNSVSLSSFRDEPYVLTRDRAYRGENLTPENGEVFLFRAR